MRFFYPVGLLGILIWLSGCAPQVILKQVPAGGGTTENKKKSEPLAAKPENPRTKLWDENQPLQVVSDRMEYSGERKVTIFRGNVRANQQMTWLLAPYLEVRSDDGMALAREGIQLLDYQRGLTVTAQELDYQKDLSHITARGKVKLQVQDEKGTPLKVYSDRLEWFSVRREALASGKVVVHYQQLTATADNLRFLHAEQKVILTRDSKPPEGALPEIQQLQDRITGETITIQIKKRIYTAQGSAHAIVISTSDRKVKPKEKE